MNTALTISGLAILIFIIVFYLKRAKEKREALKIAEQLKESKYVTEREKIRVYLDEINEKTRNRNNG